MWDTEFTKWLVTLGVGGILAAFIFSFYRKDIKAYTELWKSQTEMLLMVVKENTISNVKLTSAVEALHQRLDQEGYHRSDKQKSI